MLKIILVILSSTILGAFITFLTQMLLAMHLAPQEYGVFSASISLVMIVTPLIAMGADGYLLKYHAENEGEIKLFNSFYLRYFALTIAPVFLIYLVIGSDIGNAFFLLVISQALLNLSTAQCQVRSKYYQMSLMLLMQSLLRIVLLSGVIFWNDLFIDSVYYIYISVSVIIIFTVLIQIYYLNAKKVFYTGSIQRSDISDLTKLSYPFGIGVLCHLVYFQSDILILSKFLPSEQVAYYSLAFTVISVSYLLPSVIYQKYLQPKIHKMHHNNSKDERKVFIQGGKIMFYFGLTGSIAFYLLAEFVIVTFFGEEYSASIQFIEVLAICIFFRYLSCNAGVFLVSGNLISKKNTYMIITALLNVTLNFILIPKLGALGAAYSTIFSEIVLCVLFYYGVNKYKFKFLGKLSV
ncbi:polysaccharide biosynthesis C-terminal domain-containing protein [Vibrio breoganii]